jgi:hypothetical protein
MKKKVQRGTVRKDGKVYWQAHKSYPGGLWLSLEKYISYSNVSHANQRRQHDRRKAQKKALRKLFGNIIK